MMTEVGLRSSALLFASDRARVRVVLGLCLAAALAGPSLGLTGWFELTVFALLLLARRVA
jgi:hypothetical protein